ncbi:fork head domain protein [Dictyocaulus viviparus]|uniref:Forkhead box protein fkh-2 n=1 Tax=Dictyocaulus viviparus TaxID=29172 RepID=A0A0D8XCK7_DICVI|nr:fork head domain protein [Dictyocaulus viviparus]
MVAPYSDRLPDLNWFLNIAASPGSASLTSPRKQSDKIDYHAMNMKPPLSYAQLIMDAMAERKVKKITLSEIYEYVSRRYAYYRSSKGPWKNSIRHNLSCNQLFKRIPRQNGEKGKGSYWTINDVSTNTHNSNKKTKTKLNELENFAAKSTSRVNSAVLQYMDSIQNRHKPIAPQDISLFDEPVSIACEDQLLSNYENNSPAESSVNVDLSDCSLADVFCLSDNHSTTYEENWHNEIPSYDLEGLPSEPFVVHIEEFHCGSIDIDPNTPPQWQDVDQYYDELVRLENEEHL